MIANRKIFACVLIMQVFLSTVGYTIVRTECMVSGEAFVGLNTLEKICLQKDRTPTDKEEGRKKMCSAHNCCIADAEKQNGQGQQLIDDKCCETAFYVIHLDNLDSKGSSFFMQDASKLVVFALSVLDPLHALHVEKVQSGVIVAEPPPALLAGRSLLARFATLLI